MIANDGIQEIHTNESKIVGKSTHAELTELRAREASAVQNGESPGMVAKAPCINRTTIHDWLALYRGGGWGGLKTDKRGGRKPKLGGKMPKWICAAVAMGSPRLFKFAFALWTRQIIATLIARRYGIKLGKTSAGRLLDHLGLMTQRPLWRAYQQNPQAVDRFEKEFPATKRLAHGTENKVFLIVDGHPTHKAKKVKSFVESPNGQHSLHLLSGYPPEPNPDEWVWRNLKSGGMGKLRHLTKQGMKMEAVSNLRRLQRRSDIVRSFFQPETTSYAV